jgi:hypothetical protein
MKPKSIALLGSLLVAVGSILPWAHWTGPFGLSHNFGGLGGTGKIALAAGVIALLTIFLASKILPGKLANILVVLSGVAGGIAAVLGLIDTSWARDLLPSITMRTNIGAQMTIADRTIGSMSGGIGVFIVLAGSLLLLAGGALYRPEPKA